MQVVGEYNCPRCNSNVRLMNSIAVDEQVKGFVSEGAVGNTKIEVFCNIDPMMPPLSGGRIPAARVYYDICVGCGTEYAFRLEKGRAVIPLRAGVPLQFT